MGLLLGIDLGTTNLKILALDGDGGVVASAARGYPLARPQPGWAEQRPADWEAALMEALGELREGGVALEAVTGLGLSGQMHGLVLLGENGGALAPCQTWADERCAAEARAIERRVGRARLIALAGGPASTSATAAKIRWARRHQPALWRASRALLLPKDYLRWRLTGALATDSSDASGTLLLDLAAREWSAELLDALAISRALLPPIVPSHAITGRITPEAARRFGLPEGVPVVAGGGDTECAALGMGLTGAAASEGVALISLGTAGQALAVTRQPVIDPRGRIQTLCHVAPERWHVMGALLAGGSALEWLAATLRTPLATLLDAAGAEPIGARGLLFLPHLNGARELGNGGQVRGAFVGLRAESAPATLARAAVEGVTLALCERLAAIRRLGVPVTRVRFSGGAARRPLWARILADASGLPVETGATEHGSALGAALLAGAGVGVFPSLDAAALRLATPATVIQPDAAATARYAELLAIFTRLGPRLHSTFAELAAIEL